MDTEPLPSPESICLIPLRAAMEFLAPQSWGSFILIIVIAAICLLLSAFFSGCEIAYFGITLSDRENLDTDAETSSKANNVHQLLENSEKLLATILIANNLVNITMVVLLTFAIKSTVIFYNTLVSFLLQTVTLTFILLLFGEILPKLVAKGRMMQWALTTSGLLLFFFRLFSPLSNLMVKSTSIVGRVITKKRESISTDELSTALEISDVKSGKDKEMLEGILSFGEKEASEIMISRVDVTDIEYHSTWSQVTETILRTGFSRIPVYDTTQDNIRGILYSKDLLPYMGKRDDSYVWQTLLRPAYFVPESRMIDDLLEDFRRKKIHIAIVVDEYGGTQGIVTLEDVIEEILGDIDDEYDTEDKMFKHLSPDTYIFDAKIPLADFYRITGTDEKEFGEIGDAETLAGLLLEIKGDFPTEKESIVRGRCRFLVLDIEKYRITSVRVKVMDEIQLA